MQSSAWNPSAYAARSDSGTFEGWAIWRSPRGTVVTTSPWVNGRVFFKASSRLLLVTTSRAEVLTVVSSALTVRGVTAGGRDRPAPEYYSRLSRFVNTLSNAPRLWLRPTFRKVCAGREL